MNARVQVSTDLLELEVRELWKRLLVRDEIGLDEDFFEAGGDSITAVQMLLELESITGRSYPQSELAELTIRRIASVLRTEMPAQRGCVTPVRALRSPGEIDAGNLWTRLRALRRTARELEEGADGAVTARAGNGVPFFFCHGDFQARGIYAHRLGALLPVEQPVYLLHPPRVPVPGTTVEELAHEYLEEVRRVAPGMPVILGGYCNGGYVAWHLAHLLRSRGVRVLGLFLVETPSHNARPLLRGVASLLRRAPRLQELATRAVRSLYRHGAKRFAARMFHGAWRRVRRKGAAAPLTRWWAFVRGMSSRYVPPPIDVDVYCFLAETEDPRITEPARWQGLARSVTEIIVPGSHLSAVIAHRRVLAQRFAEAIGDALARHSISVERAKPRRSRSPKEPAAQAG